MIRSGRKAIKLIDVDAHLICVIYLWYCPSLLDGYYDVLPLLISLHLTPVLIYPVVLTYLLETLFCFIEYSLAFHIVFNIAFPVFFLNLLYVSFVLELSFLLR